MALPQVVLPTRSGIVLRPDLADDEDIFPLLRGAQFPSKTIEWSTTTLTSKSGRRFKKQNFTYPIWKFSVSYAGLSQKPIRKDLERIVAFFSARAGQFGDFYYYDPDDNVVLGQPLGVGNGVTTQFQFVRQFRTWQEPVFALNGPPTIYVDGVPVTTFSVPAPGVLKFNSAPGDGAVISWSGSFLFWCEFTQDNFDAQQLNTLLWSSDGLQFQTIRQ